VGTESKFAESGNYQDIRSYFFEFRSLMHRGILKGIPVTKAEVSKIKSLMYSNTWSSGEALFLYKFLERNKFRSEHFMPRYKLSKIKRPEPELNKSQPQRVSNPKQEYCQLKGEYFEVYFNYSKNKYDEICKIKGRKYKNESKTWLIPISKTLELKKFLSHHKINVGESVRKTIIDYENNIQQSYSAERVDLPIKLKDGFDFMDYQTVGIEFGHRVKRSLNADTMGLGKSLQAIGTSMMFDNWPVLICSPKSLMNNWKDEIEKFTNYNAKVLVNKDIKNYQTLLVSNYYQFFICNHDGIKRFLVDGFEKKKDIAGKNRLKFKVNDFCDHLKGIIIDESHEFKNTKADRFKVMVKCAKGKEYIQLLTGTPIVNSIKDLGAQLSILDHIDSFGGYFNFLRDYKDVGKNGFNQISKAGHSDQQLMDLNNKLRSLCLIRREKHQVLKDLPDKFRKNIRLDISNWQEYSHASVNLQDYLRKSGASSDKITSSMRAEILVQIGILKKLSAKGKVDYCVELVNELHNSGEKVVIFAWFKDTIRELLKHFPDAEQITGFVDDDQVSDAKKRFLSDPKSNTMIVTYKRGGVGHTLTSAHHVIFLEPGWNPKDQDQAEDRLHRIGVKSNVTAHYLIGKSTIDERIYQIINEKRKISSKGLDSKEKIETSTESLLLNDLIENSK